MYDRDSVTLWELRHIAERTFRDVNFFRTQTALWFNQQGCGEAFGILMDNGRGGFSAIIRVVRQQRLFPQFTSFVLKTAKNRGVCLDGLEERPGVDQAWFIDEAEWNPYQTITMS